MIRLFAPDETNFDHNEIVLSPHRCHVEEEENGDFLLEYESAPDPRITDGAIIKAPTPRGDQLFRIFRPTHTLRKTKAQAQHITYDLGDNFLEDVRPTATTGSGAIASILGGTLYPHPFTGSSTVANISTAYYVRRNPIQALIGIDSCLVRRWGGYIKRDNFHIYHIPSGRDLGYEIRYGKNLRGIEVDIDSSAVGTKLLPTWVDEETNQVQYLPEKYIDSPIAGQYPHLKIAEYRVEVPEGTEDPESYVRQMAEDQYSVANVDKPLINYAVDFVALRDLPEYKDFVWLEEIDLYDIVRIYVEKMGIAIESNVIRYTYDCIKKRYTGIELGNFTNSLAKSTANTVREIEQRIDAKAEELIAKQLEATRKITGAMGGNVVIRTDESGKPYEILVMDTDDIATAKDVVRINRAGIGFSQNGINGPYGVAITIDGHIVADYVDVGTLTAAIIKTGVLSGGNGKVTLDMTTGALNIDGDLTYNPTTRVLTIGGTANINAANIKEGVISSARIPNLSADKITTGTIDAQTIRIKNQDLSEFVRGFLNTPTFSTGFNNYQPATLKGTSVAFGANSQYIQMRDTGGRAQMILDGTFAVKGTGYYHEMNAGGYHSGLSQSSTRRLIGNNGSWTVIGGGLGGTAIQISGDTVQSNYDVDLTRGLTFGGYTITRGSDGNLKWN